MTGAIVWRTRISALARALRAINVPIRILLCPPFPFPSAPDARPPVATASRSAISQTAKRSAAVAPVAGGNL